MQATMCPPKSALADYLAGKLPNEDSDVVEWHLEQCPECEQAATELEDHSDSMIATLKSTPAVPIGELEPTLEPWQIDAATDVETPRKLGAYELLEPLGAGAMGAVYLARHRNLQKEFALKLLPLPVAAKSEFVTRFQREVTTTARLDHPAIVRATDAGHEGGIHYLAMDAIDGADLASVLRCNGKVASADAAEIGRQVALGLAHAHSQGVVHRDIKPSNVMLDTQGRVKILDFGLAQLGFWQSDTAEITTVGQLMGTLDYMAPEQAERGGAVDYRADLYSLGATLFKLLTGQAVLSPAPDLTPIEKLRLLSTHNAPKLRTLREDIDPKFAKLVDDLLSKDPANRPASAAHLAELLEPFCEQSDLKKLAETTSKEKPSIDFTARWKNPGELSSSGARSSTHSQIPSSQVSAIRPAKGWTRGLGWMVAAAATLSLAAAGIMFVIETSKGQLVIESVDADVDIRVVANGTTSTQELHILPGTQSTKLRGGKYSIEIDSPSDSFSVSNEEFTIRNGETVVARITPVDKSDPGSIAEKKQRQELYDESDERLEELVFKGETLDTWLRRLRFERDTKIVLDSLRVITSLASKDLETIVRPVLMEFLNRKSTFETSFGAPAFNALSRVTEESYLDAVAQLLRSADSNHLEILSSATLNDQPAVSIDLKGLSSLMSWMNDELNALEGANPEQDTLDSITFFGRFLLTKGFSLRLNTEARLALVKLLTEQSRITNENFWLVQTDGRDFVWCNELKDEIVKHALAAMAEETVAAEQFTVAAAVLDSCLQDDYKLDSTHSEQLIELARKQLEAVKSISPSMLELVNQALRHNPRSRKIGQSKAYVSNGTRKTSKGNELVSTLNLVAVAGIERELKDELSKLHEMLGETALQGTFQGAGYASNLPTRFLFLSEQAEYGSPEYFGCMRQLLYLQTGYLLGYSQNQLESRFKELRVADREARAEKILTELEGTDESKANDALQRAQYWLGPQDSARSSEVLRKAFVQFSEDTNSDWRQAAAMKLLSRISGDGFLGEFAKCVAKSENPKRILANYQSLYELKEFRCGDDSDPKRQDTANKALHEFFSWLDQERSPEIKFMARNLLKGLLRDRSQVAAEFEPESYQVPAGVVSNASQALILNYLVQQSELNNEFWLGEVNSPPFPDPIPFGELFEKEQLTRALTIIEDSGLDESERVRAYACVSVLEGRPFFDDAARKTVLRSITRELQLLARHQPLRERLQLFELPSSYVFMDQPAVLELKLDSSNGFSRSDARCSSSLPTICLNLLMHFDAVSELQAEIESFHLAVAEVKMARSYFSGRTRSWESTVNRATQYDDVAGMLAHTLLIQSGKMLGKDVSELLERPDRLAAAERERKRRFVQPGDTLAIYIPGVLPGGNVDPPVMQAGTRDPVVGFPVPVNAQGAITLPFFGSIDARGMELTEVKRRIMEINDEKSILRSGTEITVFFLMRANEKLEIRNISGASGLSK